MCILFVCFHCLTSHYVNDETEILIRRVIVSSMHFIFLSLILATKVFYQDDREITQRETEKEQKKWPEKSYNAELHRVWKKEASSFSTISLAFLDRFSLFLHRWKQE